MKPVIGVTERGDPSIDYSWVKKLNEVDGAVLITKNLTPYFRKTLLPYGRKCILHASITGHGQTALEPRLPYWTHSLACLENFIRDGFPLEHVVVRVDPIVPTRDGVQRASDVIRTAYVLGIRRFRISILDLYAHVRTRFANAGIPAPYAGYQPGRQQVELVQEMIDALKNDCSGIILEACAEQNLKRVRHCGCVSEYDLNILKIPFDDIDAYGLQRSGCMCFSGKRELLNGSGPCPYHCLYCFWKDEN